MANKKGTALSRELYTGRMNRFIEYIDHNLGDELNLDILAGVAAFSKYHFHRIFHAYTGETLADYISRIRLEKAACLLAVNPEKSITDIACECGIGDSARFAKMFRAQFHMTASTWKKNKQLYPSQEQKQQIRQNRNSPDIPAFTVHYSHDSQTWTNEKTDNRQQVTVSRMSPMTLAYLSYTGPYKGNSDLFSRLFKKLSAWLGPRGLISSETSRFIVIYHEYPDITPEERKRISICCTVPPDTTPSGETGITGLDPGICATSRFLCGAKDYQKAWDWMYDSWLPVSGFIPADIPSFEMYDMNAYDRESGKINTCICIPVMPR